MMLAEDDPRRAHGHLRAASRRTSRSGTSTRSSAKSTRVFAIDAARRRFRRPDGRRNPRCNLGEGRSSRYEDKEKLVGREVLQRVERDIMLQIVDAAVEGSPLQPRSPEGRHRPARLRPARSARRVQEGKLRAVPGDERAGGRGDRPLSVVAAAGALERGDRRSRSAPRLPPRRQPLILNDPGAESADSSIFGAPRSRGAEHAGAGSQSPRRSSRRASAATMRGEDGPPRRAEGRPQRSVPVRQREEIQEVPRCCRLRPTRLRRPFSHMGGA